VTVTRGWLTFGRVLLSASALIVAGAVPPLLASASPGQRAAAGVGLAAFVATWLWFWWSGVDSRRPLAAPLGVAALVVLLALLTAAAPPGRDGLLFAALAAGAAFPTRRAAGAVTAIAVLAGTIQLAGGGTALTAAGIVVNDLVVGVAAVGGRLLLLTNRELVAARGEIAALAATQERLRVARDIHDLLGQDLTLAVLKSELAARELPPDAPAAVRELLAETSAAVRKSLDDVRAAVAGFRQPGLTAELASASAGLAAAGIELSVDRQLDGLPPEVEEALAWALREAVTNVLRHSGAHRCSIAIRREGTVAVLQVADDGAGLDGSEAGSGLAGIAERLATLDGALDISRGDGAGSRLRATVPLSPP
jgi:two-component system sensor histidine kinase DesK